jgi:hypothetical protein
MGTAQDTGTSVGQDLYTIEHSLRVGLVSVTQIDMGQVGKQ